MPALNSSSTGLFATVAIGLGFAGATPAHAGGVANWINPLGGLWTDAANWSPAPPAPGDRVSINLNSAFDIELPTGSLIADGILHSRGFVNLVRTGPLNFETGSAPNDFGIVINGGIGESAVMRIDPPASTTPAAPGDSLRGERLLLAPDPASNGELSMLDAGWRMMFDEVVVGGAGSGTITIGAGADFFFDRMTIAAEAGSTGLMQVQSTQSAMIGDELNLGTHGEGMLVTVGPILVFGPVNMATDGGDAFMQLDDSVNFDIFGDITMGGGDRTRIVLGEGCFIQTTGAIIAPDVDNGSRPRITVPVGPSTLPNAPLIGASGDVDQLDMRIQFVDAFQPALGFNIDLVRADGVLELPIVDLPTLLPERRWELGFFGNRYRSVVVATSIGDVDADGTTGFADLVAMLAAWGPCPVNDVCRADLDRDGNVTFTDLLQLLAAWGG